MKYECYNVHYIHSYTNNYNMHLNFNIIEKIPNVIIIN